MVEPTWNQVDELLRRRYRIQALQLLLEQQPQLSFAEAQSIAAARYAWLTERGEVEPKPPLTVDTLLAKARAITDRVVAVEGYWDGDSDGWYPRLVAIVDRP